jgi:hypothetical protein
MALHLGKVIAGSTTIVCEAAEMAKRRMEHFRKALRANPDAAAELPERSYHRYITGDWPQVVRWLLKYPELLAALEKDAREDPEPAEVSEREVDSTTRKVSKRKAS